MLSRACEKGPLQDVQVLRFRVSGSTGSGFRIPAITTKNLAGEAKSPTLPSFSTVRQAILMQSQRLLFLAPQALNLQTHEHFKKHRARLPTV